LYSLISQFNFTTQVEPIGIGQTTAGSQCLSLNFGPLFSYQQ
jgi:hypothetical protein